MRVPYPPPYCSVIVGDDQELYVLVNPAWLEHVNVRIYDLSLMAETVML